jgi:hypothetical protein
MRKLVVGLMVSAVALTGSSVGMSAAHADTATITLSGGSAVFGLDPAVISAATSVAGTVAYSVGGVVIKGCEAIPTSTTAPFVARCSWTPAAAGPAALTATLTPADKTISPVTSTALSVKTGVPVQGVVSPITMYVDEILATGSTGTLAPFLGGGCSVTSTFLVGQTIVFRVYANDADLGGAVLDSSNTAKAYVEVAGVPTPITLTYGNHSGAAFWTGVFKTGPAPLYNTLGVINFKVTMVTKDSKTVKVFATKRVPHLVNGKQTVDPVTGRPMYDNVSYYRTRVLDTPIAGSTGTWQSNFNPMSQLTLFAVPTK